MTNAADKKGFCDCNQGRLPCTCKQLPPAPPPMRGTTKSSDIGGIALIIILALAIGIACGWKMRGFT